MPLVNIGISGSSLRKTWSVPEVSPIVEFITKVPYTIGRAYGIAQAFVVWISSHDRHYPCIKSAAVDLDSKEAVIVYDDQQTDVDALTTATARAGFESKVRE